jgi:cob(I)alamin adenosyltransferase
MDTKRYRVVLLTGDGRGKTTSAWGLVLRAVGHDQRVCVVQFMKSLQDTGEVNVLKRLPAVEVHVCGLGFVPKNDLPAFAAHRRAAEDGLQVARRMLRDDTIGMVVLDEVCGALTCGLLSEDDVLSALDQAHDGLIIVLTGRGATPGLQARADTVSRIECVKHGLDTGWKAQPGVER